MVLTCAKLNFCVWVKWVPLARISSEGAEPLKDWSISLRSDVDWAPPKELSGDGCAAERSCSSMRFRSRVSFLDRYSCWTAERGSEVNCWNVTYVLHEYIEHKYTERWLACGVRRERSPWLFHSLSHSWAAVSSAVCCSIMDAATEAWWDGWAVMGTRTSRW